MPPVRLVLTVVVLFIALHAQSALASCDGQSQMEMNQCAAERAEAATSAMNIAFNELYSGLEDEERFELFRSQVAWIQYMRSWCNAYTSSSKGGSIRPLEIAMCQETLTRSREKELSSF